MDQIVLLYTTWPDAETADRALAAKAAMADALGIRVSLCGDDAAGRPLPRALARL